MALIGGNLGYQLLRRISPSGSSPESHESEAAEHAKLGQLFGERIYSEIRGKTVIDFGCGEGAEAVELARGGAKHVIGIDIRESVLETARQLAQRVGVADRCEFVTETEENADIIVSCDAFEHFDDPEAILNRMRSLLRANGEIWISFGPTWYHPHGGHLFSVFPWAHLAFTEKALIRWRSDFKSDGATRFGEVEGGLNQMTIRRFEKIVMNSTLDFEEVECVPIRGMRILVNPLTREFFTSIVRCRLQHAKRA